jgi:hypothetical protein
MIQAVTFRGLGTAVAPGRGDGGAPQRSQELADQRIAAGIPAATDVPPEPGGVGAAGVPPLAQVRLIGFQNAGPLAGAVVDQEFLGVGGAANRRTVLRARPSSSPMARTVRPSASSW